MVVIGGSGGSGTRLICEILQHLGYNMGTDLNESLDNLLFTFLLKRPSYFTNINDQKINKALSLFDRVTHGQMSSFDKFRLYQIYKSNRHTEDSNESFFKKTRFKNALKATPKLNSWGWKEPNSQLFLPYIHEYYPYVKYIHVIRNGYYMCQSNNEQQLNNWGTWFGLETKQSYSLIEKAKFWIATNSQALNYCNKHLKGNHLVIHYEELLLHPELIFNRISQFTTGKLEKSALLTWASQIEYPKLQDDIIKKIKNSLPEGLCRQIDQIHT